MVNQNKQKSTKSCQNICLKLLKIGPGLSKKRLFLEIGFSGLVSPI